MQVKYILDSSLYSYSQIFFSQSKITGILLLAVSFFDWWVGLYGLISILTANGLAYFSGFSKLHIQKGLYGFNALLTGLGIAFYYQPSYALSVLIVVAAVLTLLISLAVEGVFYKYGLPFLSLPFIISLWLVFTASQNFEMLNLSERNLFIYNELYAIGGKTFTEIYAYVHNLDCCEIIRTYLMSLGAIIFQPNILAGILIFIGLLAYSRIVVSLSLVGFFSAYFFYTLLGNDFSQLAYNNIGFNYILTSVAVGGFFIIPSVRSYLWTVFLLPVTVVITIALQSIFARLGLGIYALPFNIVVLTFLYVMKIRIFPGKLQINYTEQESPEKSLYFSRTNAMRFGQTAAVDISLPFWGEWKVTQGYNGKYTHKGEWQHALDFEKTDSHGKTYKGAGNEPTDYFCYGKPVTAPADGTVVEIINGIDDNPIGQPNSRQNWGNSIIIKHGEYIFSQLSHLQKNSFTVKKGEQVKAAQTLAKVGNSGYSPVPHLHFQMQSSPVLGATTMPYPLANYVLLSQGKKALKQGVPEEADILYKPFVNTVLKQAFTIISGQQIQCVTTGSSDKTLWIADRNIYNQSYIRCRRTGAKAYYILKDEHFYFINFEGNRKSELFVFFMAAYHVKFLFVNELSYTDSVQINFRFSSWVLFFYDFAAPFIDLLKAKYSLRYIAYDEMQTNSPVQIQSCQNKLFFKKELSRTEYQIRLDDTGEIIISDKKNEYKISKLQRI